MASVAGRALSTSKTIKTEKPSRVLFICIYDPVVFQLTNDLVYNKFSVHGRVSKVLIFERNQVTKLFVEFMSIEDSQQAKNKLDGTMLHNNYCKMNIFYSNLKTIDLRNRNSQGKDYSTVRGEKPQEEAFQDHVKTEKKTYDDFAIMKQPSFEAIDFSALRSFKSDQANVLSAISEFQRQRSPEKKDEMDQRIERDILRIVEEGPSENMDDFQPRSTKRVHIDNSISSALPIAPALLMPKQSEIITFAVDGKLPLMNIYNLFSNYGNIDKIVYKLNTIYVQFSDLEFAVIAKDYLQNMVLEENILRLNFGSRNDIIERLNEYSERMTLDNTYHRYLTVSCRFSSTKSIAINPPSRVLHVSNLKKEACNADRLSSFFSQAATPDKVQILMNSDEKNMALVKFNCLEDSVKALSQLHNKSLLDRKVQLSFTKSKI